MTVYMLSPGQKNLVRINDKFPLKYLKGSGLGDVVIVVWTFALAVHLLELPFPRCLQG